jgi:hypothetical protein
MRRYAADRLARGRLHNKIRVNSLHVVFLGARLPLTKTFVQNGSVMNSAPYPHVSKVTSYHEQAADLPQFKALLEAHAAQNHCLFNGHLQHPLVSESRAGKTLVKPREWLVFDFDKVPGKDAAEIISKYLPPCCQDVSYVVQLSASMFRPDTTLWSGHIFMLLAEPIEAQRLKQWFEYINFTVQPLYQTLSLSDSLQALHWPLDRTVAYDSKLIYIAPPKCHGFEPAIKQHISYVKKKKSHLSIPGFTPIDQHMIRQKINELRRNIGEQEIDYDITMFEGHEMLRRTDLCEIHGIRTSGDHYIRFNLNGGDSCAYFIDLRNPEIIRNFKGEPFLATKDAAPDLYKSLRKAAPNAVAKPALDDGAEVLAFYATNQNSAIKVGVYQPTARKLVLNSSNETAARAWRAEYGLVQKEFLPHYDLVYDPTSDVQFIAGSTRVNTFRSTEYMARPKSKPHASSLHDLPPIARKTIDSILGNPDEAVVTHFVNWLSFIFQFRKKTGTAWVLNGVEGTGKGSFFKFYLTPLFGQENVATVQFANVKGEFNGFLENNLLTVFEEADIKAVENAEDLMAKIKIWITDSPLPIRKMRTDVFNADNYSNFLLFTNMRTPVHVSGTDRRFSFGERQDTPIYYTPNEIKQMVTGAELEQFADVLARWPVDESAVTRVVDTQARTDAHEATTAINQLIAEAIMKGDLQFLVDRTPSEAEALSDFHNRFSPLGMFKTQLDGYLEAAAAGAPMLLRDEDLFVIFRTLIPDTRFFQDSKTWRKRHYKSLGLDVDKQQRLPGSWDKKGRGVLVQWRLPEDALPEAKTDKVTNIKKKTAKK